MPEDVVKEMYFRKYTVLLVKVDHWRMNAELRQLYDEGDFITFFFFKKKKGG